MNLFLSLLFALSAVFNAPTVCAHAAQLGGDHCAPSEHQARAAVATMSDAPADHYDDQNAIHSADHHSADQHAGHSTPMKKAPPHAVHDGLAADCHGGPGCEGCVTVAAAIFSDAPSAAAPASLRAPAQRAEVNIDQLFNLEPPPPRLP